MARDLFLESLCRQAKGARGGSVLGKRFLEGSQRQYHGGSFRNDDGSYDGSEFSSGRARQQSRTPSDYRGSVPSELTAQSDSPIYPRHTVGDVEQPAKLGDIKAKLASRRAGLQASHVNPNPADTYATNRRKELGQVKNNEIPIDWKISYDPNTNRLHVRGRTLDGYLDLNDPESLKALQTHLQMAARRGQR